MRLHFYGTKGYVEESSRAHAGHSAFVLEQDGFRLLCDFGQNLKGMLPKIRPNAIFVSHAHPDHGWGLEEGTAAPVHASAITHELLEKLPIENRVVLAPGKAARIGPFRLTAFPVAHSVRCPGIAARIAVKGFTVVYSGDIISFEEPERALAGADLYIGDGSTLTGSLVRRHPSGKLMGHTTVRAQLGWLARHGVPRAIFSHFGKGPIEMGEEALRTALSELAEANPPGCDVIAARDGLKLEIGP
ncbi:MAG TPA: MBL fold metallo-hydrolase [Thermoanaerobaculia bacterium]|jgi:ribonuclease BN (tRNA processing enzyme)